MCIRVGPLGVGKWSGGWCCGGFWSGLEGMEFPAPLSRSLSIFKLFQRYLEGKHDT